MNIIRPERFRYQVILERPGRWISDDDRYLANEHGLPASSNGWTISSSFKVSAKDKTIYIIYWVNTSFEYALWICDDKLRLIPSINKLITFDSSFSLLIGVLTPRLVCSKDEENCYSFYPGIIPSDGRYNGLLDVIIRQIKADLPLVKSTEYRDDDYIKRVRSSLYSQDFCWHSDWLASLSKCQYISISKPYSEDYYRFSVPLLLDGSGYTNGYIDPSCGAVLILGGPYCNHFCLIDLSIHVCLCDPLHRLEYFARLLFDYIGRHRLALEKICTTKPYCQDILYLGGFHNHIGHHLWNDISGLAHLNHLYTNNRIDSSRIHGVLFNTSGAFGRLDCNIFEILSVHKINRPSSTLVDYIHENSLLPIRLADSFISEYTAASIRKLSINTRANLSNEPSANDHSRTFLKGLALYLRVHNRSPVNQDEFIYRLLIRFYELSIIDEQTSIYICGSNTTEYGATYQTHHSTLSKQDANSADVRTLGDLDLELLLSKRIQERIIESGIPIIIKTTIGANVLCELNAINTCELVISPWGASLAKPKWIHNKRCIVLISEWSLKNMSDLHIYDSPLYRENAIADNYLLCSDDDSRILRYVTSNKLLDFYSMNIKEKHRKNYIIDVEYAIDMCTSLARAWQN